MSAEFWMLVTTAVLAVVAISAAVVAVRAARRVGTAPTVALPATVVRDDAAVVPEPMPRAVTRVVDGRVIVPPTQQQVVATAMSRPGVRLSIAAHGLAHALRAESRDRIQALMRREFRRRRRERLQAGRRAVRATRPTPASDRWLGELPSPDGRGS